MYTKKSGQVKYEIIRIKTKTSRRKNVRKNHPKIHIGVWDIWHGFHTSFGDRKEPSDQPKALRIIFVIQN